MNAFFTEDSGDLTPRLLDWSSVFTAVLVCGAALSITIEPVSLKAYESIHICSTVSNSLDRSFVHYASLLEKAAHIEKCTTLMMNLRYSLLSPSSIEALRL